jgi:hypothetical protein
MFDDIYALVLIGAKLSCLKATPFHISTSIQQRILFYTLQTRKKVIESHKSLENIFQESSNPERELMHLTRLDLEMATLPDMAKVEENFTDKSVSFKRIWAVSTWEY